jgi:hypothetical protein
MSIITLAVAKEHIRATGSAEDVTLQLYLNAAEQNAAEFLNRIVYADSGALATAKAAQPALLAAATTAYDAAIVAADLLDSDIEKDIATQKAEEDYAAVQNTAIQTYRGIVINDGIKAGILLTFGHLCENREDTVVGAPVARLPMGAQSVLMPYRVGLGV